MNRPLSGFSVLEIGNDVGIRYCGHLLAALGANVVRTEAVGDAKIGYAGYCGEAYGLWLDHGKSISPAAHAHVPGFKLVMGGQDPDTIATAQAVCLGPAADAMFLALSWFDPAGPYGRWTATDEIIAALNGAAYSFGESIGPPMLAQGHAPQITAGLVAFIAALAAQLEAPSRRPRRIDVNVFEASLCFSETGALTGRLADGASVRLGVNRFVPTYPCSPYRTSDGWVGVTCLTPAQWNALCGLIDRADMLADSRFATAYQRLMISEEVDAALAAAFALRSSEEWVGLGIDHRIPIAPMLHPGELPNADHWLDRGAFGSFGVKGCVGPTLPFRMSFDGAARTRWSEGDETGPLAGLKVVDFSMGWAGPLCARTLGDLGADVVKIESEGHPDWWRGWETGAVDATTREVKHNFIGVNRNKRGVDIDLTGPTGRAQVEALIARSDVVVENFAAGVLDKLGLGAARQRALNPGLISLSMPAFGNGGPLSGLRAYGSTVEQASGMPFANGEAEWAPSQQHIAFGDPVAGLYAAGAVLAALYGRSSLGGAYIDLAQVACLFQLGADAIIAEQVLDAPVRRTGHARTRLLLCAVVPSGGDDHWLAVAVPDDTSAGALARIIGGFDSHALTQWASLRSPDIAAAVLQAAGVPAAPVARPHGLTYDPQLCATGFWLEMERQFVGHHIVGASPFRFDGARPRLRLAAPLLGEHTAEVLAEIGHLGGGWIAE
jgi:crotonobetainyl-CoA:carnitine CoA-transferase CaiB-like acyl-CoA transferase